MGNQSSQYSPSGGAAVDSWDPAWQDDTFATRANGKEEKRDGKWALAENRHAYSWRPLGDRPARILPFESTDDIHGWHGLDISQVSSGNPYLLALQLHYHHSDARRNELLAHTANAPEELWPAQQKLLEETGFATYLPVSQKVLDQEWVRLYNTLRVLHHYANLLSGNARILRGLNPDKLLAEMHGASHQAEAFIIVLRTEQHVTGVPDLAIARALRDLAAIYTRVYAQLIAIKAHVNRTPELAPFKRVLARASKVPMPKVMKAYATQAQDEALKSLGRAFGPGRRWNRRQAVDYITRAPGKDMEHLSFLDRDRLLGTTRSERKEHRIRYDPAKTSLGPDIEEMVNDPNITEEERNKWLHLGEYHHTAVGGCVRERALSDTSEGTSEGTSDDEGSSSDDAAPLDSFM